LVVNEYLSEKFPEGGEYEVSPLMPKLPAARARVRIVASRSNDLTTAYFTYLSNKDEVTTGILFVFVILMREVVFLPSLLSSRDAVADWTGGMCHLTKEGSSLLLPAWTRQGARV